MCASVIDGRDACVSACDGDDVCASASDGCDACGCVCVNGDDDGDDRM